MVYYFIGGYSLVVKEILPFSKHFSKLDTIFCLKKLGIEQFLVACRPNKKSLSLELKRGILEIFFGKIVIFLQSKKEIDIFIETSCCVEFSKTNELIIRGGFCFSCQRGHRMCSDHGQKRSCYRDEKSGKLCQICF